MMISSPQPRAQSRHHRRRWIALAAAVGVGVGSFLVAQPAAAVDDDSWISEPADGLHRFTVPAAAVQSAVGGTPAMVAVEGNFGPGKTWAQLNLSASGGNWSATMGPLEPGFYYYQYEATMSGTEELKALVRELRAG